MKKKRTLITVGAMILLLSVVTYAYYTTGLSNSNAQTAELSTGTMSLTFDDGDNGIAAVLNFGDTITKKFTLQNTGSLDASASISWFNLVNTYLAGSLMYELEYSETLEGDYEPVVSNLMVPTSEEPITTPLVTQVTVPTGKTYYYNLNITLVNSEVIDQTSDINASFHTQFTIKDASSLSDSEQTLANLGLVVSNGTPDFSKAAGTTWKDNGFSSEEKTYNVSSSYISKTIYYSDTYTYNESTGLYSLGTIKSGTYKDIASSLKDVYISGKSTTDWYLSSTSYTTNISAVYKITSASYDASTNKGSWTYLEPNKLTALPDYSTTGIYSMEDDYGTSYYFRGAPENNYVKFGKNEENKDMYWRAVRVNGDGSLRITFDGINAYKNGTTREPIGTVCAGEEYCYDANGDGIDECFCEGTSSAFYDFLVTIKSKFSLYYMSSSNSIKYANCIADGEDIYNDLLLPMSYYCEEAGGTWTELPIDINRCLKLENGIVVDKISEYQTETACKSDGGKWTTNAYEAYTANIANSPQKTNLDNWYKTNIYDKGYSTAVSDTSFCNDRSLIYGDGILDWVPLYIDDGFGFNSRIAEPSLKCSQQNDAFTVNDITKGNGDLTYPVGTVTADELIFAGANGNYNNKMFYLNKGVDYITMTPRNASEGFDHIAALNSSGNFGSQYSVYDIYNIIPVINLTPEYVSQMIGDGTIGNEFRVE